MSEAHQIAHLHCSGIGRNADDCAVESLSAIYGASTLQILERPASRCIPSLLELAILTL